MKTLLYKTYSELITFDTFEERFDYLKLKGIVGKETFGFDRYINQNFYRSTEWKQIRDHVIARDLGLDLGVEGYEIYDKILIHHMNPITLDEVKNKNLDILNPEYLISTSHKTHNAIHYGNKDLLFIKLVKRKSNDTKLW